MRIIENTLAGAIGAAGMYGLTKRKRPRMRKRVQHFVAQQHGTQIPLSHNLLHSAHVLLGNALEERKQPVWRTRSNHSTWFAPAIVLTVLTAFDAWINELIGVARVTSSISIDQIGPLIDKPLADRYRDAAKHFAGKRLTTPNDLKLLSTVRHEIVHFLPYVQDIAYGNTVPEWLMNLEKRQLLIESGNPYADFHLSQKLCSYALAYWACETAFSAAHEFASFLNANVPPFANADNFAFYQSLSAPADLGEFDRKFALTLTR